MSEPAAKPRQSIDFDEFERRLRNPESAEHVPSSDPLAELARLVDGGRDPYADVFSRNNRRPGLRAVEPPESGRAPSDAEPRVPVGNHANDWSAQQGEWPADGEAGRQDDPVGQAYQGYSRDEVSHHEVEEAEWDEAPAEHRSHRGLFIVLGLLALVGTGVGAALMLRGPASVQDAPFIKADGGPMKVQPEVPVDPVEAARAPSVLDKSPDRVGATRVVNNVEQPIDVNSARAAHPIVPPQSPAPATAPAASVFPEPRRVRTIPVRPDGSLLTESPPVTEPPKPPMVVLAPTPTPAPRPAASGNGTTPAAARPMQLAATPTVSTPPKATARVTPPADATGTTAPKPVPPRPVQLAGADLHETPARTGAAGGFAVQLAAAGSDAEARDRVSHYTSQYSSALGGHRPSVVRGDVNGKPVYRVRVVGLSRENATTMCQQIKDAGGACFISGN